MGLTAKQREVIEGISPEDLASIVGAANRASTEVRVNDTDDRKYGDVSIFKVQANGYARPKMGVYTKGIPALIEQLQTAFDVLENEQA